MPARTVLYDHREALSGIPEFLQANGIEVQAAQLPVGDYIVSDRVAVERKTGADLRRRSKTAACSSTSTGSPTRTPRRVDRRRQSRPHRRSELERRDSPAFSYPPACPSCKPPIHNKPRRGSPAFVASRRRAPSAPRGLPRVRRPTDDSQRNSEDVLTCLPGISTVGARRLLAHFGSLSAVYTANVNELREVPGIGPTRAAVLAQLFAGTSDQEPAH